MVAYSSPTPAGARQVNRAGQKPGRVQLAGIQPEPENTKTVGKATFGDLSGLAERKGDNASSKPMSGEGVELEAAVLPGSGHLSSEQIAERSFRGDAFR
jgi:hypothetical protein